MTISVTGAAFKELSSFFVIKWLVGFFSMHLHPANLPKQIQQLNFPKRLTKDKKSAIPKQDESDWVVFQALPYQQRLN